MYRYCLLVIALLFGACKIQTINNRKIDNESVREAILKAGSNAEEIKAIIEKVPQKLSNAAIFLISYILKLSLLNIF